MFAIRSADLRRLGRRLQSGQPLRLVSAP
jgi:hypothetical protein